VIGSDDNIKRCYTVCNVKSGQLKTEIEGEIKREKERKKDMS
jgi:hypothetical protein